MKIELKDQNRTGVLPEHEGRPLLGGGIPADLRMTIPAREELQRIGTERDGTYFFTEAPQGLLAVMAPELVNGAPGPYQAPALRLEDEPEYPGETEAIDMWLQVALTPCPKCGAALVHYEAGYVPGYRVCAGKTHHHFIAKGGAA